jgi:hypothetical protein
MKRANIERLLPSDIILMATAGKTVQAIHLTTNGC